MSYYGLSSSLSEEKERKANKNNNQEVERGLGSSIIKQNNFPNRKRRQNLKVVLKGVSLFLKVWVNKT